MRMGLSKRRLKKRYIVILMTVFIVYFILIRLQPVFLGAAHDAANMMINEAVNKSISDAFADYSSESFYTEKDNDFTGNTAAINTLKSDIITKLNENLTSAGEVIKIPLGSVSGLYLLNGVGIKIPVKILPYKMITADFESDFESAGINFIKHTVYINVSVTVNYRGFILNEQETISIRIPVIENVTSGEVPQYYGGVGIAQELPE